MATYEEIVAMCVDLEENVYDSKTYIAKLGKIEASAAEPADRVAKAEAYKSVAGRAHHLAWAMNEIGVKLPINEFYEAIDYLRGCATPEGALAAKEKYDSEVRLDDYF